MEATFKFITQQLQKLLASKPNLLEAPTVEPYRWLQPKAITHTKQNDLDEIGKAAIPKLACFIRRYRRLHKDTPDAWRAKVAIIDSGVVLVGGKRRLPTDIPLHIDRVVSGMSFVHHKDGIEYPWWHAGGPHGTQMTSLVCAVDPWCDVYVARVTETDTSGVSAQRVAQAILWAVEQKVDIISLSLSMSDWSRDLTDALQAAKQKDIVIFCATADEGNNILNTNFADYALAIAACDSYGKDLNWSQVSGVNYKLPGKDISVGTVPFVESTEVISGSSVSTAIAAGLASLILSCYHLADNNKCTKGEDWRRSAVKARFDKMNLSHHSDSRDQYVRPWLLVGRDSQNRSHIPELDTECDEDLQVFDI